MAKETSDRNRLWDQLVGRADWPQRGIIRARASDHCASKEVVAGPRPTGPTGPTGLTGPIDICARINQGIGGAGCHECMDFGCEWWNNHKLKVGHCMGKSTREEIDRWDRSQGRPGFDKRGIIRAVHDDECAFPASAFPATVHFLPATGPTGLWTGPATGPTGPATGPTVPATGPTGLARGLMATGPTGTATGPTGTATGPMWPN